MQTLSLRRERSQDSGDILLLQKCAGKETLKLELPAIDILESLLCGRRDGLEAPFFKGDTTEELVAVDGDLLLPALLGLFPVGPGLGSFVDDALLEGRLLACGELFLDALAVDEGAAGGDGEEEEAHGG